MKTIVLTILIASGLSISAFAEPGLPAIVTDGLKAYQKSGSKAAMEAWLKGSQLANDPDKNRIEEMLATFQSTYGKMTGFEVIGTKVFSPSSKRIYLVIKLELARRSSRTCPAGD